jgi:hypothetical protein
VLRLLRILPIALLFAGTASAQTTGTIIGVVTDASTGKPVAGALVLAKSPNLQGEQTAITDDAGNYRLTLLPPGAYALAVQLEGFKPFERTDIRVSADKTIRANLSVVPEAVQLEEQVVRTGAPAVDVASAEAGAVVSQEFMSSVPVGRGYEAIAVVAPTAKFDTYGVSFAGSQSPENGYIIDGLNATDPAYGTRGGATVLPPAALRSNFIQEIDIKTGSYGAEYGRATGGIMNVVLKSGSNEFGGSVFTTWEPSSLFEPEGQEVGAAGEAIAYKSKPDEGAYTLDYGFEVGGPILKDKLWFYAGFAPVIQKTTYERYYRTNVLADPVTGACPAGSSPTGDVHGVTGQCVDDSSGLYLQNKVDGSSTVEETGRETYQWVGKLTYLVNENHNVTLSSWGAPGSRTQTDGGFFNTTFYNAPSVRTVETNDGMTSVQASYKGKFLEKRLIAEVNAGWFNTYTTPVNTTAAGVDQGTAPQVEWLVPRALTDFEDSVACSDPNPEVALARCPVYAYLTGGRGGNFENTTNRYVGKASVAYHFDAAGSHNVKGGLDFERLNYDVRQEVTGGSYYLYLGGLFTAFRGYGNIVNPGIGPGDVPGLEVSDWADDTSRVIWPQVGKNKSQTDSIAYFLQDVWQIPAGSFGNVTLNYGLRLETQSMENLDFDSTGFDIKDNWAPRVSAIWDFTGTGRGKVGASWGRFYYAMPLDMGNRAFGGEISLRYNLEEESCGFVDGVTRPGDYDTTNLYLPAAPGLPGCQVLTRAGANNDFRLTGATLTPADPDLKGQFVDQFGAEVEYEVLPDVAVGVVYQGRRQGYVIEDMSSNDGGTYYIGNPGKDTDIFLPDGTFAGNSKYVTTVDPLTGREVEIQFPKPERSYDAVTFQVTKQFSQNWLAQANYTYSYLRGNYAGPYRPEDGQLDPGITSEYDLASLMANKNGYLPGDTPHQIKLYAAYVWNLSSRFNVRASGAYNGISGTPVNVLGAHPDYGSSQAFIIPRGQGGRTPWTNTFDLGGGLEYVIKAPYAVNFSVDIFNLFNSQEVVFYDEDYTFDSVAPISGINCDGADAAGTSNPIQTLHDACPAVAGLKTVDGRDVTVNPNWGRAGRFTTAFQAPLSVRFGLALTF